MSGMEPLQIFLMVICVRAGIDICMSKDIVDVKVSVFVLIVCVVLSIAIQSMVVI